MRILFFLILSFGITHAAIVIDPENGLRATATRRYLERQIEQTARNCASLQSGVLTREDHHPTNTSLVKSFKEMLNLSTQESQAENSSQQTSSTHTENTPDSNKETHTLDRIVQDFSELETRLDISTQVLRQSVERHNEIERMRCQIYENIQSMIDEIHSDRTNTQNSIHVQDNDTKPINP